MAHANAKFGAHEGRRDGGVDVAINENEVWLALEDNRLEANHDFGGLLGVTARTNGEVNVRSRDVELLEEDV